MVLTFGSSTLLASFFFPVALILYDAYGVTEAVGGRLAVFARSTSVPSVAFLIASSFNLVTILGLLLAATRVSITSFDLLIGVFEREYEVDILMVSKTFDFNTGWNKLTAISLYVGPPPNLFTAFVLLITFLFRATFDLTPRYNASGLSRATSLIFAVFLTLARVDFKIEVSAGSYSASR